jgi:signal transduction histidine kinase
MSSEPKRKRFSLRPRARIVRTFGEELISNDFVAIVELVKNSYDADARNVSIEFSGPLEIGQGSITIRDDGVGMSPDDVATYWMEPASISKFKSRKSKSGRSYLGQKGIGRFSTSKLAEKLTLITRKEDYAEVEAVFDWAQYHDPNKYLDEIEGFWEERDPNVIKTKGTILEMSGLHSAWSESKVQELVIQLQRLVSPVAPIRDFKITLSLPEDLSKFAGKIEPPKMLSDPDYTVRAKLDSNGKLEITYSTSDKEEIIVHDPLILSSRSKPEFGPAEFEFRVWDRDKLGDLALELKKSLKSVQQDLNALSGISVYRDDFRVSPYGNKGNDWLRLDLRRVQSPTLRVSNNQIVGRISITDQENPELKDQTNREGIVESDALRELKEVAKVVLSELESRRYKARPREGADEKAPLFMQQKIDLGSVREVIEKKLPDDTEVREALDKKEQEINQRVDELRDVVVRYRRLSTLGQLMDVVLHDAGNSLSRVNKGIKIVEDEIKTHISSPSDKIERNILHIKEGSKLLTELFKRLEPFGGRRRERAKMVDVGSAIEDVFKIYETELEELSIQFSLPQDTGDIKISESDLKLIIINLLNNSLFWLQKVTDESRSINVSVESKTDSIEIIFQDSGPGVSEDDSAYIFAPYYSKKPDGVGLGLTIVGELVTEFGGNLELVANGDQGAKFKITLPLEKQSYDRD